MGKRFWFQLHGWFSLPVWLLFCFICLTGTISVISHEITWLANPAARASNPQGLPPKPLPELVAAVERVVPGADIGSVMVLEPYLVTAVTLATGTMPHAIAYVNPYTAEVQAVEQGITFIGFMRSLHAWLLFPWHHNYSWGYYLVALMSFVVLGAMVTGLLIYKRFWQAFTQPRLRLNRGWRVFLGDFHRLAGVWSLWFLLVIGVTGLWYLTQALMWHNERDVWDEPPTISLQQVPQARSGMPAHIALAQALQTAQAALPSLQPAWVSLPEHHRDYYSIAGSGDAMLFDQYAFRAFINPWSGEAAEVRQPATMDALQAVSHLADPLHYGTFGGLWTKAIWFVSGVLLSAMSLSGFLIWRKHTLRGLRQDDVPRVASATVTDSKPGTWVRWKYWLSSFILVLPLWYLYQSLYPEFPDTWEAQAVGPVTATIRPADEYPPYAHEDAYQKDFSLQFCDGCVDQIRYAYLSVGERPAPLPAGLEGVLHGDRYNQHVHAPFPRTMGHDDRLWLTLQTWDGATHHGVWAIPGRYRY